MSNHWTQRELHQLGQLLDQGLSAEAIAHRLGRAVEGVHRKCADIGRPLQAGRLPARGWSEQDDRVLREMAAEGKSASQIATRLGRSRSSVIGRAGRKGVTLSGRGGGYRRAPAVRAEPVQRAPRVPVADKPFSEHEELRIVIMVARGMTHRAIAAALGRVTAEVRDFATDHANRVARGEVTPPAAAVPSATQSAPVARETAFDGGEGAEGAIAHGRGSVGRFAGCQWIEGDPMPGDGCKCMAQAWQRVLRGTPRALLHGAAAAPAQGKDLLAEDGLPQPGCLSGFPHGFDARAERRAREAGRRRDRHALREVRGAHMACPHRVPQLGYSIVTTHVPPRSSIS